MSVPKVIFCVLMETNGATRKVLNRASSGPDSPPQAWYSENIAPDMVVRLDWVKLG